MRRCAYCLLGDLPDEPVKRYVLRLGRPVHRNDASVKWVEAHVKCLPPRWQAKEVTS